MKEDVKFDQRWTPSSANINPLKKIAYSYNDVGSFKVTYMITFPNSPAHEGRIKIGDATYHTNKTLQQIISECDQQLWNDFGIISHPEIDKAAHKRVKEYTGTADIEYNLEFAALNVRKTRVVKDVQQYGFFRDYTVHEVLMRSGFQKKFVSKNKVSGEWFEIYLTNAIEGFKTVLAGKDRFLDVEAKPIEISLRNEQRQAVGKTKRVFRNGTVDSPKSCLWNAIMRFGKTVTAFSLVKEIEESENIRKVLIITHRPVVSAGWSEDFVKVFGVDSDWQFGAKKKEHGILWENIDNSKPFFYFASIQDLRGSFYHVDETDENPQLCDPSPIDDLQTETESVETVEKDISEVEQDFENIAKLSKNQEIFDTEFDLIIVDESHEGTKTELAQKLMTEIKSRYKLHLSGTPFNIIDEFEEDDVYNWTYVDERKANEDWIAAREDWNEFEKSGGKGKHPDYPYPGEINPYGNLPSIEIRTLNVEKLIDRADVIKIINEGNKVEFTFAEFFRINKNKEEMVMGEDGTLYHPFVHADLVEKFLNTVFATEGFENDEEKKRNFPFASKFSRELFAHTFWMLPSVGAAIALKEMLRATHSEFHVINATADNDGGDALTAVREAIDKHPYTITLSVGKLTTGTTIPEWTGVFMLNDMSSPMLYLQTIFRVKSSGSLKDGRQKEVGYVFDFSPNRCLKMISESAIASVSSKEEKTFEQKEKEEKKAIEETLNYLPILSFDGTKFETNDSHSFMQALNRVYIQETVHRGFATPRLFNFDIHNISQKDAENILDVRNIVKAAGYESNKTVQISESELTTNEKQKLDKDDKDKTDNSDKEKKEISEAEKKLKNDRENARQIVRTLTGVSIRIPLLVFAYKGDDKITLDNFSEKIDDESWIEFMPKGFTKEKWNDIKKYFNNVIFEGSCEEIINRVKAMDHMLPLERVSALANLFATFKSPDKETVLTPFRVINMQVSQTLGGLRWTDDNGDWFCTDGLTHSWNEILDSYGEHKMFLAPKFVNPFENDAENVEMFDNLNDMWDSNKSTFYDINSKTALYPLFAAATLFKKKLDKVSEVLGYEPDLNMQNSMWRTIVKEQIFVNVRVDYSKTIAQRVLLGYNTDDEINCSVIDVIQLRNLLKNIHEDDKSVKKLSAEDINKVIAWVLLGVKDKENMSVDDRLALLDENIQETLKKIDEAEDERFTAVLSNPPYNLDNGSNASDAIYHHFMNVAKLFSKYISMVYPAKWTNSGRGEGLDAFRTTELNSKNYSVFIIHSGEDELFKTTTIKGGTNYFLWSMHENENLKYYYNEFLTIRTTLINGFDYMIKDPKYINLIKKIQTKNSIKPNGSDYYGTNLNSDTKIEKIAQAQSADTIAVYYSGKGGGINKTHINKSSTNKENDCYKVFISKTADPDNKGSLRRPGRIFPGNPKEICSSSLISVDMLKTKKESKNCVFYLKTNFSTFLFGILCTTQNAYAKVYKLIPDVDFATGEIKDKPGVFLDFEKPETLDEQLANIYQLTKDEQELMKNSIKPWKDKLDVDADGLY